jgi:hypothetical protein
VLMSKFTKPIALSSILCLLPLQGCTVSGELSASTTCDSGTGDCKVTAGGKIDLSSKAVAKDIAPSDLVSVGSGNYVLSASVPSNFVPDTNGNPITTITVTTDTGYISTISLQLVPTSPAIAPVNPGDSVYSYALPNNAAFNAWMADVAANTNVGMSLTSASGLPLVDQGGSPGSYTLSTVLTSTPTGTVDGGSVGVTIGDPSGPPPCEPHLDCIPQT